LIRPLPAFVLSAIFGQVIREAIYCQLWTTNLMASGFKLLGGIERPHGRTQFRYRPMRILRY
jgi:hypothetical protein